MNKIKLVVTALVVTAGLVAAPKAEAASCSAVTSGPCVAEIGTSTPTLTAVQIATSAGVLSDIQLSSSTAAQIATGAFCVAFDSAPAAGSFTGTVESDGTATAPRLIAVQQTTLNATTQLTRGVSAPFTNGLVIMCKGVTRALAILSK